MSKTTDPSFRDRWARLRFSIIGHLLAAPPAAGELHRELAALAAKTWRHPATGLPVRFAFSTLERWLFICTQATYSTYCTCKISS